jgi:hypothetical protein
VGKTKLRCKTCDPSPLLLDLAPLRLEGETILLNMRYQSREAVEPGDRPLTTIGVDALEESVTTAEVGVAQKEIKS